MIDVRFVIAQGADHAGAGSLDSRVRGNDVGARE
jgi:hypothetical protein